MLKSAVALACLAAIVVAVLVATGYRPGAAPPGAAMPVPAQAAPDAGHSSLPAHLQAWDALPLEQRRERRARYAAWRELTPDEREQLRALARQVEQFDYARAQALRVQFEALGEAERRGWRLGPQLGADYQALHPLLAFVPADQRLDLLAMLRSMPADQRAELAILAQRTPPQDRQALRQELLSLQPAQRGRWLRQRLAR